MELTNLFVLGGLVVVVRLYFRRSSRVPKFAAWWSTHSCPMETPKDGIRQFETLNECHEVVEVLNDLVCEDGAGSWPPAANHRLSDWPEPLRPYRHIYLELAALLPQAKPSLDDEVNVSRIAEFRGRFQELLDERVDLAEVIHVGTQKCTKVN
jgi:hypothetical protein